MSIKKVIIDAFRKECRIITYDSKGNIKDSYYVSDGLIQAFLNVSKRKSIGK